MSTIELEDVTKVYSFTQKESLVLGSGGPSVMALDHLHLVVPDGQTMAIIGPSGCGKSTLLRIVAGLDENFSGRVLYDGVDMAKVPAGDRYIGMVFQDYALYPHFESEGNLKFFFKMHRAPNKEAEERIRITSEIMGVGFKELLRRKPGTLSGGQQQRVAIARAIVRRPRLFLLDEPLSNLDAKLRVQTRTEIKRLLRAFQITALYVTHDQVEAVSLGDQIAVMREGKIEQVGLYQEIWERPASAFAAGFLGSPPMNLLSGGQVVDGALRFEFVTVPLPSHILSQIATGQSLILGVRPEAAVVLSGDGASERGICLKGKIEVVEPDFGRRTQTMYVRTADFGYAANGPLDPSLNVGDWIETVFPTERLYFFDQESGRLLG
jgi:ABC-type sugar transport system ATPase subunit